MKTKRRSGMYQKASDPNRIKDLLMLCCQAFIELKNVQFWKKASNAAKDFKENNNSSLKRWNTSIYLLFILTFLVISKVCAWKGKTKISNDNEICISTAPEKRFNIFLLIFKLEFYSGKRATTTLKGAFCVFLILSLFTRVYVKKIYTILTLKLELDR